MPVHVQVVNCSASYTSYLDMNIKKLYPAGTTSGYHMDKTCGCCIRTPVFMLKYGGICNLQPHDLFHVNISHGRNMENR